MFDHLSVRTMPEEEVKQQVAPPLAGSPEVPKGSFHTSQFDSKASDYFLLLNQKNHNVVKKRQSIKMKYSEQVMDYEQIFVDLKKDRIGKEAELMQKIYEEQIRRQSMLVETLLQKKETDKKVQEQQQALQRLQTQRESETERMKEMTVRMEEQRDDMEEERNQFELEKQEFENKRAQAEKDLKEEKDKLDKDKGALLEIYQKVNSKKGRQEEEQKNLREEAEKLAA